MSRPLKIVLPDPDAARLEELARAAGQATATLAAHMVRHALARAAKDGHVRAMRSVPAAPPRAGAKRPGWLEPYGGSASWRAETWGAILALHGRYPRMLRALKDGWWVDHVHLETLCALAAWRSLIDDGGQDPREELAFHAQLADYAHTVRAEGGGVTKAWQPGAPPADWRHA
jgi:hypothetical protein